MSLKATLCDLQSNMSFFFNKKIDFFVSRSLYLHNVSVCIRCLSDSVAGQINLPNLYQTDVALQKFKFMHWPNGRIKYNNLPITLRYKIRVNWKIRISTELWYMKSIVKWQRQRTPVSQICSYLIHASHQFFWLVQQTLLVHPWWHLLVVWWQTIVVALYSLHNHLFYQCYAWELLPSYQSGHQPAVKHKETKC